MRELDRSDWVKERWCIALEGVVTSDGRALVEFETKFRDPAPVVRDSHVVGKLYDFERIQADKVKEIHATYEGPVIPPDRVISCDMLDVDTIPQGDIVWLTGTIAGAVLLEGQNMFGDAVRRVNA